MSPPPPYQALLYFDGEWRIVNEVYSAERR